MDNTGRVACCNVCLLSPVMMVCESCPFNPGKLELEPEEIQKVARKELLTQSQIKLLEKEN